MTIVLSCTRGDRGGSPTGVVDDDPAMTDEQRRALPAALGVSHVGFVRGDAVRFFTPGGELVNCGHGLIAVQAALLLRSGGEWRESRLRVGRRAVHAVAVRTGPGSAEVWFDQGVIGLSAGPAATPEGPGFSARAAGSSTADRGLFRALGIEGTPSVADPGTPRVLLPVPSRAALAALRPDPEALAAWCREHGLLGCLAYAPPRDAVVHARMFAPAVGVPEDVLNANSAGCLAAHLHHARGRSGIVVHQGDGLGRPGTVRAAAVRTGRGIRAALSGTARLA